MYVCYMAKNELKLLNGTLQTIVLKLLSTKEHMYGYEITQTVKTLTEDDIQITEGALYPALHKLEAEGLLETTVKVVDGRARKYYRLTEKGKLEAPEKLSDALSFVDRLHQILTLKPSF